MARRHDPSWKCIGYQSGGQPFVIDGVDVTRHPWTRIGAELVTVRDLHDPIFLNLPIYEVVADGTRVKFVAGQFRWDTTTYFVPTLPPTTEPTTTATPRPKDSQR